MIKEEKFFEVLNILNEYNLLNDLVVIGTWAEFLYKENNLLQGFNSESKTMDIDFLIINKNKPQDKINLPLIFKEKGYLVDKDRFNDTTIIMTDDGFQLEFLLSKLGEGLEHSLETNTGIKALTLRHLDILKKYSISLEYNGILVKVPIPEAYIIQKMIINETRSKDKQKSDNLKIKNLYKYIDKNKFDEIYNNLSKKQKKKVENYLNTNIKKEHKKDRGRSR